MIEGRRSAEPIGAGLVRAGAVQWAGALLGCGLAAAGGGSSGAGGKGEGMVAGRVRSRTAGRWGLDRSRGEPACFSPFPVRPLPVGSCGDGSPQGLCAGARTAATAR